MMRLAGTAVSVTAAVTLSAVLTPGPKEPVATAALAETTADATGVGPGLPSEPLVNVLGSAVGADSSAPVSAKPGSVPPAGFGSLAWDAETALLAPTAPFERPRLPIDAPTTARPLTFAKFLTWVDVRLARAASAARGQALGFEQRYLLPYQADVRIKGVANPDGSILASSLNPHGVGYLTCPTAGRCLSKYGDGGWQSTEDVRIRGLDRAFVLADAGPAIRADRSASILVDGSSAWVRYERIEEGQRYRYLLVLSFADGVARELHALGEYGAQSLLALYQYATDPLPAVSHVADSAGGKVVLDLLGR